MSRWLLIATLAIFGSVMTACTEERNIPSSTLDLPTPQGNTVLEVTGNLTNRNSENGAQFDMEMLRALPTVTIETHTSVTDGVKRFEGFLLRDLLTGLGASGNVIRASAINDYIVEIPISDLERFDVIVAHSMDGEPLSPHDKGPLWMVYPRDQHPELQDIRYDYRWVWQLNVLDVQ